jgi:hypothetical protein
MLFNNINLNNFDMSKFQMNCLSKLLTMDAFQPVDVVDILELEYLVRVLRLLNGLVN